MSYNPQQPNWGQQQPSWPPQQGGYQQGGYQQGGGYGGPPPQKTNLTWLWILLGAGGLCIVVCCGGCILMGAMAPGDGSEEVQAAFESHPSIIEHIGTVTAVEFNFIDSMDYESESTFVYDIRGTKGSGQIITEESDAVWETEILSAELELPDGQRFRLR